MSREQSVASAFQALQLFGRSLQLFGRSLLHLLLTTHYMLGTYYSLLTTYHLLLATCYLLPFGRSLLHPLPRAHGCAELGIPASLCADTLPLTAKRVPCMPLQTPPSLASFYADAQHGHLVCEPDHLVPNSRLKRASLTNVVLQMPLHLVQNGTLGCRFVVSS